MLWVNRPAFIIDVITIGKSASQHDLCTENVQQFWADFIGSTVSAIKNNLKIAQIKINTNLFLTISHIIISSSVVAPRLSQNSRRNRLNLVSK